MQTKMFAEAPARLGNHADVSTRPHLASARRFFGHVVFVPAGEEKTFEQMPESLFDVGTLTVGESTRVAERAGIVNFTTVDSKVRFEINADAAERAGLKISAQLQKLATVVRRKT